MKKTRAILAAALLALAAAPAFAGGAGEGKEIFEAQCVICHQLPDPGMLKIHQWKLILGVMQSRFRENDMAPLSEKEMGLVLEYLKEKSRR